MTTRGNGPHLDPDQAVENPPCTCPEGTEPWEPEWDGSLDIDPECPWHGADGEVPPYDHEAILMHMAHEERLQRMEEER